MCLSTAQLVDAYAHDRCSNWNINTGLVLEWKILYGTEDLGLSI